MYSIDDHEGNLIATGLDERIAQRVAQEYADEIGQPVWLYQSPGCEMHGVVPTEGK